MIAFNQVSFSYGSQRVFDGFSHEFEEGKIHVIMGPSGCGKTSLMRLLLGLEQPRSGSVLRLENSKLSAVFQEDRLIEDLSVRANIELPNRFSKGFNRALFAARAQECLDELGIGALSERTINELSGGQARRVSIARALLCDFDVLVLDEPLKGFDEKTRSLVAQCIIGRISNTTVFWVTHYQEELKYLSDYTLLQLNC